MNRIKDVVMPSKTTTIWRYMSFARFKQMIESHVIYLSRIDHFSDFNEGSLTQAIQKSHFLEMKEQGAEDLAGLIPWFHRFLNHKFWYATCWNSERTESNLLWRAYGLPKKEDEHKFKIAIKSTVERLLKSIDNENLYLGRVNYLDFESDDPFQNSNGIDSGSVVYIKKQEYKAEHEIRLAFQDITTRRDGILADLPETAKGVEIPVNLNTLIDEIYIESFPVDWTKLGRNITGTIYKEYQNSLDAKVDKQFDMIEKLLKSQQIQNVNIKLSSIL